MFEKFSPLKNKIFRVMDDHGKIIAKTYFPELSETQIKDAFERILYARTADLMAVSFQRQGRMYTYPPNLGQEAIAVAAGLVMRDEDWLIPAYRELGAYLAKGATMKDMFLLFGGHEDGGTFPNAKNIFPLSVPIASQLLHAAGIGYAIRLRNEKRAVFTFVGDGGTSEGDFHEAINFAGVWKAPVIFTIQNNGYAISQPREKQTAAENLAMKAVGYGIPGIQVDGNDIFAMIKTYQEAAKYAIEGGGPVLIEAITYRQGAHTTSDDPSKYRTKEEEKKWQKKDPLERLKKYLLANNFLQEGEEEKLVEEFKKDINAQFREFENYAAYTLDDVFNHIYAEMPEELVMQRQSYEKYLKWKGSRA